jgi:hypothetical protein
MNEENQGLPPVGVQQNIPPLTPPITNEANLPRLNNNFSKKKIIIYGLLLFLVLAFIVYTLLQGGQKGSESSKVSPTPTTNSLTSPTSTESPLPTPEFVQDELIVKYKQGMGPDEVQADRKTSIEALYKEVGVVLEKKLYQSSSSALKNYYLLNLKTSLSLENAISKLKTLPEIENVEKNYINKTN